MTDWVFYIGIMGHLWMVEKSLALEIDTLRFESCLGRRKQQLELDTEQQTGSK